MSERPIRDGYDAGYRACPCFWGKEPSRLVRALVRSLDTVSGLSVLDAGCGEGKNAAYLASLGASVLAVDLSGSALKNGLAAWPKERRIRWQLADIREVDLPSQTFDIVVAYGLFHCLETVSDVASLIESLRRAARVGGYHVVCCFNSRQQNLAGHPGFDPLLTNHAWYLNQYSGWEIRYASDEDLFEAHPNNHIEHSHSVTRILARKPA